MHFDFTLPIAQYSLFHRNFNSESLVYFSLFFVKITLAIFPIFLRPLTIETNDNRDSVCLLESICTARGSNSNWFFQFNAERKRKEKHTKNKQKLVFGRLGSALFGSLVTTHTTHNTHGSARSRAKTCQCTHVVDWLCQLCFSLNFFKTMWV
jgi:hypothetical protein